MTPKNADASYKDVLFKPQVGAWYVHLGDAAQSGLDWAAVGVADTFFKRVEVSYGYEYVSVKDIKDISKHNLGVKLLLLEENQSGCNFLPAISVGGIYKNTTGDTVTGLDATGYDFYLVATKLIPQLPLPVLLSAGMISTNGVATGVLGFDHGYDQNFFGNIDIIPFKSIAVGFEYKQGADLDSVKNADYWDAHVAQFVNKSLTLIAAYVDSGSATSTTTVGLGGGLVLSAQYQF